MDKKKKIIILISITTILIVGIVACIILFKKPDKTQNQPNNNQNQSGENNKPNNNNTNNNNSTNNGNSENNNNNQNQSGNSNGNSNQTENNTQSGTTSKNLRIYSCRRTITENGIEFTDSLNLKYHTEKGPLSDEVILTIKPIDDSDSFNTDLIIDVYKKWFDQLNELKGITVTSTKSENRTVFSIKTDYTKVDYSSIDFEDENRLQLYNDIRANDSLEIITEYLDAAGYTCQS